MRRISGQYPGKGRKHLLKWAKALKNLDTERFFFYKKYFPQKIQAGQFRRLVLTFQELILALHKYWTSKGCLMVQPYDIEVGAGTFNPSTFLRVLGPEPWSACYVEPSRRPTDGRYGENPNRLQHYYQYQVILKPSPQDVQELYLDSLREIGLDPL